MMCKSGQYKLRALLTLYAVLLYASFVSVAMTAQLAESKESMYSFIDDNDVAQAKTEYNINDLQAIRHTENAKISRSIYSKIKSLFGTSSTTTSVAPSVNCNHGVWNSSRNICVCESGWETSLDQDILNNNFEYCTKRASATSTIKPEDLFAQTDAGNKRLFIGLICGGVALIIILITLYCYCCRHRRQSRVRIESPHMQTPWQHFWNKCTGNQHHNNQLPLPLPLYTGNQLPLPVQDPYMIGANNYQIEYLQGGNNNNNNNRYTRPQITFDRYYNPNSQNQLNTADMSMTGTQLNEKYISQPYTSSTPIPDTEEKFVNSSYNMYNSELSGQMMQYNDAPSPEPVPPTSTSMLSSAYNNINNNNTCYPSSLSQMANYNSSAIPVTQYYSAPPVNNTPALQSYEASNCQAARQHSQVREPFYEDYNNNNNNNNCDDKSMQMCMTRQANGNVYTHNAAQLLPQYQANPSSHRKSRNHSVQPSPIPTSHEPFAECTEPISEMYEQHTQFARLPQVQPELSLQYPQQQEQQEQVQHTKEHRKESRQRHHRHRSNSASHHRNKKSNDNNHNENSAFIDPNACAREVYNNAESGNHDNTAQDQNMIAINNVSNNNKNCTGEKYQHVTKTNSRLPPSNTQNRVLESTLPEQYDQSYVYGEANAEQNKVLQKVRRHKHASANKANAQN